MAVDAEQRRKAREAALERGRARRAQQEGPGSNWDDLKALGKELGNIIEAKIISMKRPGGPLYDGDN